MVKTKVYTQKELTALDDKCQKAWQTMDLVIDEVREALLKYQHDRDAVYADFIEDAEATRDVVML